MEENKASVGIVALGYGALLGIALIIFSLLLYILDLQQNKFLGYISFVIMLAGLWLAQLNYRKKYLGGFMPYSKAFVVGFLMVLFATILSAIYTFIFFKYIDPNAMAEAKQLAEQSMLKRGMTDQQIDQSMAIMAKFQTPMWYAIWGFLASLVIGTILALITSAFTRKEDMNAGMPTQ